MKGDIYEGLLAKSAEEVAQGSGPVFHAWANPFEGTWGRLRQPTACRYPLRPSGQAPEASCSLRFDFVNQHQAKELDKDQKRHLRTKFGQGLGTGPEHGPPVHHEPLPARH